MSHSVSCQLSPNAAAFTPDRAHFEDTIANDHTQIAHM